MTTTGVRPTKMEKTSPYLRLKTFLKALRHPTHFLESFLKLLLRFLTSTLSREPKRGKLIGPGGNFDGLSRTYLRWL